MVYAAAFEEKKFFMEIIEWDPKYRNDFVRLNTEWLTKLYYIETFDLYSMDHVDELIAKGAMVLFCHRRRQSAGNLYD